MTNNKKQTAVEWQFEQLFNSFEKFNNGEYIFLVTWESETKPKKWKRNKLKMLIGKVV